MHEYRKFHAYFPVISIFFVCMWNMSHCDATGMLRPFHLKKNSEIRVVK